MPLNHVALILDGNRRYAKALGLPPYDGHKKGAETLRKLIKDLSKLDEKEKQRYMPKEVSMYIFSMQNFKRSKFEVDLLMSLFVQAFTELAKSNDVKKLKLNVDFLGRLHLLPAKVQRAIKKVREKTKSFKDYKLNFCIAYGGREEIIDAINKLLKSNKKSTTEKEFNQYLYNSSEPDIVIRTGGVIRTSNFLPWQTIYSEWFFLDKTWPEFTLDDYKNIVEDFYKRERRFGK